MKADEKHDLVGRIQRDFLIEQGLQPHHRLLDIGCGWLRAGRFIIPYLDTGHYVGIEKDAHMLEKAHRAVLSRPEVARKRPRIIEDVPKDDLLADYGPFDYALMHSVLTHLTPGQITGMLETVMPHTGVLYASFDRAEETHVGKPHKWRKFERVHCEYPFEELAELAEACGCEAADLGEFGHPSGQEMMKVVRS